MLSKKIISLGLVGLLSASLLVGCGNDTKDESKDNTTKQEQKVFKEEVITDNEYIKMTLVGKEKNEFGAITLKVLIENKVDKDIGVYAENIQVNGVMNDPCWCCNVNAKAQAYSFIEWYPNNEMNANVKTVEDLKNIKGDIYVADTNYNEIFRTQISILSDDKEGISKDTNKDVESYTKTDKSNDTSKDTSKENKKKDTVDKEKSTEKRCWICNKRITNENFGGYSDDGTMICYNCLNKYGKDEPEEPKEEPVYDEYGYDQYGNYDPNKDLYNDREWNDDDYERWDDTHGDEEEPIQEDNNIDEETGLAKIKNGTHLGEEAERQDNMEEMDE